MKLKGVTYNWKRIVHLAFFLLLIAVIAFVFLTEAALRMMMNQFQVNAPIPEEWKTILYWYPPFGEHHNIDNIIVDGECGKCIVTYHRFKINSPSTRAVIFHYLELSKRTLPAIRNPNQLYIYYCGESPAVVTGRDLHKFDDVFNLTMNYRRDSDIYDPYSTMPRVMEYIKNTFKNTDDAGISWLMEHKNRSVTWIVSNCVRNRGSRKRMKLVEKLVEAGMEIDRRGACFPNNPPPVGRLGYTGQVHRKFLSSSKFYLAFENAHHCKDYITEKLYNALFAGTVPIVWGARKEDYEAIVPPHSCIYVDDFADDLTKLVDYIDYLDKNDAAYKEYLNWRMMDAKDLFGYGKMVKHCQICKLISGMNNDINMKSPNNEKAPVSKVIKSIKDWTFGDEEEECVIMPKKKFSHF